MSAPMVSAPRIHSGRTRSNAEKWSWMFMRFSGSILIVLIFTHLFINLVTGGGVSEIDFGFVAGKWASPLWQVWDLIMLVLAMLHGSNGMRLLINDYAQRRWVRTFLLGALALAAMVIITLGTLVIFTFDPCPAGADPSMLPSFCPTA